MDIRKYKRQVGFFFRGKLKRMELVQRCQSMATLMHISVSMLLLYAFSSTVLSTRQNEHVRQYYEVTIMKLKVLPGLSIDSTVQCGFLWFCKMPICHSFKIVTFPT